MITRNLKLILPLLFVFLLSVNLKSQISEVATIPLRIDTTSLKGIDAELLNQYSNINFSIDEAVRFLQRNYRAENWKDTRDPFRQSMNQLIWFVTHEREYAVRNFLNDYPYDSIKVPMQNFYVWDTIRIQFPEGHERDSIAITIMEEALAQQDRARRGERYDRLTIPSSIGQNLLIQGDTILLVLVDTLDDVSTGSDFFPFRGYDHPFVGDSIQAAVFELVKYLESRDSTRINLTGTSSNETPMWLNSGSDQLVRFWLRNEYDDSVTVWVGSQGYNRLGLYLENNIMFRRPIKSNSIVDASVNVPVVDNRTLKEVQTVYVKPNYWRYTTEISAVLNQAFLTNWVKGGESNVSSVVDITFNANYLNTPKKFLWYNQGRLKHGFISSKENGLRRNADLVEFSSKLNHKAFGKFDFSGTILFKTQLAKGYNYPKDKDPILVSRILSPATLTIGIGLDYKPNKETSFNFAPLSYKGTFVMDTVLIDQKKYGVEADRKARHEPGASLLVNHKFSPVKNITVSNKVQFFTNYINKPQNVDIDWELIATASLNWFTDVRINTHFIFDDDTRTIEYDKNGDAILGSDGQPRKTARIQFKEIIGFSFIFRF
ncbi:MAG: DUF3078 domain-containing protein [Bacteroidales bacterium]|nr:DUF3078 domain-containing protein [Bacteroidales bacterium]